MPKNATVMMKATAVDADGSRTHIGYVHQDADGFVGWDANRAWLGNAGKTRFRSEREVVEAMIEVARVDARAIRSIHWRADA
ncbi:MULTISPECIES: hypothetical protein [unclassified Devosia]|uniref:hypothetical protein n=1 Tax=unclassified Devosia TaxID=196773 RepID=UPI001ACA82F5|nr:MULTISPECIES: hypothetical protein [unclassified Devosia]MBN9365372.1 hypothetical protein [Devosia sp.]